MHNHRRRASKSFYCCTLSSNLHTPSSAAASVPRKRSRKVQNLILKMCSVQEMQCVDRELSSELEESPINPAFLHMSVPLFYLQLNGVSMFEAGVFCWSLKLPALKKTISEYRAYLVYFGCTSGWPKGKTEVVTFFLLKMLRCASGEA